MILEILASAIFGGCASLFLQFCYLKGNIFRAYYSFIAYHLYCKYDVRDRYYKKIKQLKQPFDFGASKSGVQYTFNEAGLPSGEFIFLTIGGEKYIYGLEWTYHLRPVTRLQAFKRAIAKPMGLCVFCQNAWVTFAVYFMLNGFGASFWGALIAAPISHCFISFVKSIIDTTKTDWEFFNRK